MDECKAYSIKKNRQISCCLLYFALFFFIFFDAKTTSAEEELVVSAAASLTNVMQEIGKDFEAANTGTEVVFNFAGSGALYMQIANGAPVDVFASADQLTMDQAQKEGHIMTDTRKNFARNTMVLVVPYGSKSLVKDLKGLEAAEVKRIALGNPETVPAGRYTKEVLTTNGLWDKLMTKLIMAESVRQVLDYVSRAEVDAGFVYNTDAAVAKERIKVVQELQGHKPVVYPIAVVASTKKQTTAKKFLDFVTGQRGQEIFIKNGFLKP